jgi:hypothetical protein
MTTQPTDKETDIAELREDLTCEIHVFHGDLKGLGYDLTHIPDFLKATRALAIDIHIPKLRKQIASLQKIKECIHQNSISALRLAWAPSEDRSTKALKRAHPKNLSVDAQEQSAATSHPRAGPPKRLRPAVASVELPAHSGQDVQYRHYGPNVCCAPVHKRTYDKTARAAEFLYNQLTEDKNIEDWACIPTSWITSRTFPDDLTETLISVLVKNCYLALPNLLAAAKARDI